MKKYDVYIDTTNFIFMTDKTKINYDIGIDDRVSNDIIKNIRDSEYI